MQHFLAIPAGTTLAKTLPLAGEQEWSIVVAEQGNCTLSLPGNLPPGSASTFRLNVTVQANAAFHCIASLAGGATVAVEIAVALVEPGARALVTAMAHSRGKEVHAFRTTMHHIAPHTSGDIALRAVGEQQSRGDYSGLIRIDVAGQQTRSYFRDDVLLLDAASAKSVPTLEISANDVRASHGSTTSRMDAEQLFYLRSRGLSEQQARRLIVNGFVLPVLRRVPEAFCEPFLQQWASIDRG
jgi:Fe-S cluster assembly scaffold protein SufB